MVSITPALKHGVIFLFSLWFRLHFGWLMAAQKLPSVMWIFVKTNVPQERDL